MVGVETMCVIQPQRAHTGQRGCPGPVCGEVYTQCARVVWKFWEADAAQFAVLGTRDGGIISGEQYAAGVVQRHRNVGPPISINGVVYKRVRELDVHPEDIGLIGREEVHLVPDAPANGSR